MLRIRSPQLTRVLAEPTETRFVHVLAGPPETRLPAGLQRRATEVDRPWRSPHSWCAFLQARVARSRNARRRRSVRVGGGHGVDAPASALATQMQRRLLTRGL